LIRQPDGRIEDEPWPWPTWLGIARRVSVDSRFRDDPTVLVAASGRMGCRSTSRVPNTMPGFLLVWELRE
jgi:hypothetical protein